jgi:hypothetical protein
MPISNQNTTPNHQSLTTCSPLSAEQREAPNTNHHQPHTNHCISIHRRRHRQPTALCFREILSSLQRVLSGRHLLRQPLRLPTLRRHSGRCGAWHRRRTLAAIHYCRRVRRFFHLLHLLLRNPNFITKRAIPISGQLCHRQRNLLCCRRSHRLSPNTITNIPTIRPLYTPHIPFTPIDTTETKAITTLFTGSYGFLNVVKMLSQKGKPLITTRVRGCANTHNS